MLKKTAFRRKVHCVEIMRNYGTQSRQHEDLLGLGRHTELAGERAARVLPAVFALAEGCVEALAADSQRAEALADVSSTEEEDTPAPVLSDRQVSSPCALSSSPRLLTIVVAQMAVP